MPINFNTLVKSEHDLKRLFCLFYKHVIITYDYLLEKVKSNQGLTPIQFASMVSKEEKANNFEAKILDEANWIISKDMPRAAHLRYLIAIIRSIKDLERMGDFAFMAAQYFHKHKEIEPTIRKILISSMEDSIHVIKTFSRAVMSKDKLDKGYIIRSASPLMNAFYERHAKRFKDLGTIIFSSKKTVKGKVGAFKTLSYLERNTDHGFNIVKSFMYIKDPNFYFKRKENK